MAQNGSSSPINSVVSTLTITSVVLTDAGNYTCRMRGDNNAELMGTAQLIVTLPPSSVTPTPVINIPTLSSASMCIHSAHGYYIEISLCFIYTYSDNSSYVIHYYCFIHLPHFNYKCSFPRVRYNGIP